MAVDHYHDRVYCQGDDDDDKNRIVPTGRISVRAIVQVPTPEYHPKLLPQIIMLNVTMRRNAVSIVYLLSSSSSFRQNQYRVRGWYCQEYLSCRRVPRYLCLLLQLSSSSW